MTLTRSLRRKGRQEVAAEDESRRFSIGHGNAIKGIGKIRKVKLREIWKHEAADFTKWLQENPDVIGDIIGLQLFNCQGRFQFSGFSLN